MNHDQWNLALLTPAGGPTAFPGVAILADRQLSLAALTALLSQGDRRRVSSIARGRDAVRDLLSQAPPAVVIVEMSAPGSSDLGALIQPASRVLLLLDPDAELADLALASQSGASGFLSHAASPEALEAAITDVLGESQYVDPALAAPMLEATAALGRKSVEPRARELSPRETDILTRVAAGKSSKQIAREVGVTPKTVCNHVSNIYAKLHLRHRGQLVLYATRAGLTKEWDAWQPIARGA